MMNIETPRVMVEKVIQRYIVKYFSLKVAGHNDGLNQ